MHALRARWKVVNLSATLTSNTLMCHSYLSSEKSESSVPERATVTSFGSQLCNTSFSYYKLCEQKCSGLIGRKGETKRMTGGSPSLSLFNFFSFLCSYGRHMSSRALCHVHVHIRAYEAHSLAQTGLRDLLKWISLRGYASRGLPNTRYGGGSERISTAASAKTTQEEGENSCQPPTYEV